MIARSELSRSPAFIGVNLEVTSHDAQDAATQGFFGRFSHGRYVVREGVWTLLKMFDAEGVKVTFFADPYDAARYPHMLEAVAKSGHEVAMLGPVGLGQLETEERLQVLEQAVQVLRGTVGSGLIGWRSADGWLDEALLSRLARLGFRYDSSFYDDDRPYLFSTSDGLVAELPVFENLTDSILYGAQHTTRTVEQIWAEELEAIWDIGGYLAMTLSCRSYDGSGRNSRACSVGRWISEAARKPGLEFYTAGQIAQDAISYLDAEAMPKLLPF